MGLDLATVRNIGIAAHIDAGKTTTTERMLFYTGRTHRVGEVDEGTTTTDFDEQEQQRGITIYSAAVSCLWRDHTINLIDTPGHVDFTAEVERSLRVLDGMVAVFDAREGVEAQSETVWRQADRYDIPRICFLNKMDRVGADFERSVMSLRERLGANPLVIQWPIGAGGDFRGLIDLVDMQAIYYQSKRQGATFECREIPSDLISPARTRRHELLETLSEYDEPLMLKYLNEDPIGGDEIRRAIREATISRVVCPVLCGSALRHIGVQRLLDAVCDFLPSPLDVPSIEVVDAEKPDGRYTLHCDASEPVAALVFKIISDKPVDLFFLRIYSGTLKCNMRLRNSATGEKENITRIYRMFAKRRDQLDCAFAGDIVAVVGPKRALTGHSLCDHRRLVVLEPIHFPDTVLSMSVEPKSSKDRDKLLAALQALVRQDPTLAMTTNVETGQLLLSGMGELHLEVMVHRLRSEMNVDVSVGKPHVSYRETVGAIGEATGRFSRQIGGREHFGMVQVRLEPREAPDEKDPTFEIASEPTAEETAPIFLAAIKAGMTSAAQSGILGGYPVINWKATVLRAQQHETDSSELAFENAGRLAFYEAMAAASPVLLQPIMRVEIVTSEGYLGAIMADLNTRKAFVRGSAVSGTDRVIRADVPLSQMFGYVTRLRSLSQGRATTTMTPSHYAPVSADETKVLVG